MQKLHIETLKEEIKEILTGAVGEKYASYMLESKKDGSTLMEAVMANVTFIANCVNEGMYSEDDIKSTLGQVLCERLGINA